jgi:hypothetical protein
MANYEQDGNRYTLLVLREPQHGQEEPFYRILPYEYVRFNVDTNPGAEAVIVPTAPPNASRVNLGQGKLYERIQFVDQEPNKFSKDGAFSAMPGQKP